MNDLYLLTNYLSVNKEFTEKLNKSIFIGDNTISIDGKVIDFTGFDIKKFLNESPKLINDMESLSMNDVYNIIKIHVDYSNMLKELTEKQNKEAKKQAKEMVDNIISHNPALSNLHLFDKRDSFGNEIGYLHYVDEKGENKVLANVNEGDFIEAYSRLSQAGQEITPSNLFNYLDVDRQKEQVYLENKEEAAKRTDVSEEHLNNFQELDDYNDRVMENHNPVVGNEEHGIYLNNGQINTIYYNQDGRKVIETHGKDDDEEKELQEDVITNTREEQLISFGEYKAIITKQGELSPEDVTKVREFENFLFDVITYKDYLNEDLYQVYTHFYQFWDYLATMQETTKTIEDTKMRFADIQERATTRAVGNVRDQVAVLTRKNDNQSSYGYVNAALYVGLIILVGVVIAVIAVLAK